MRNLKRALSLGLTATMISWSDGDGQQRRELCRCDFQAESGSH